MMNDQTTKPWSIVFLVLRFLLPSRPRGTTINVAATMMSLRLLVLLLLIAAETTTAKEAFIFRGPLSAPRTSQQQRQQQQRQQQQQQQQPAAATTTTTTTTATTTVLLRHHPVAVARTTDDDHPEEKEDAVVESSLRSGGRGVCVHQTTTRTTATSTTSSSSSRRSFLTQSCRRSTGLAILTMVGTTPAWTGSTSASFVEPAYAAAAAPSVTADTTTTTTTLPPPLPPPTTSTLPTSSSSLSLSTAVATTTSTSAGGGVDWEAIVQRAAKKAIGGGTAGASAAIVQVLTLMWLRTAMNYQYRYGGSLQQALNTLYNQGGITRLYQGLPFALVQGPLTRFGDTAANVGVLALLDATDELRNLPLPIKTACASCTAGLWRVLLMPIDASKTALQVEGSNGLRRLWDRALGEPGPSALYRGAAAQVAATAVGHFPWFVTYNYLDSHLPPPSNDGIHDAVWYGLLRSAGMGLVASGVSDTISNSLRVVKTTAQTAQLSTVDVDVNDDVDANNPSHTITNSTTIKPLSYPEVVALIVERDGLIGLFGRGLQTRLLTNAIQGALFSVLWKYFQQRGGDS